MKKFIFKLTAVFLSVVFVLVCLEIAVRVLNLSQPRTSQADPILGHALIPGQSGINEFGVKMEIGPHGFRGPAPDINKPPGVFRVVCLGDSFLHAEAISYEAVFHNVVNRDLEKKGLKVELINLGVEAYDTAQEYLVYKNVGRKYQPDLVILFFYVGNDLIGNYPPQPHRPSYIIENGELKYVPFEVHTARRNWVRDFLRRHARIYTFLPDLWRAAVNNRLGEMFSEKTRRQRLEEQAAQFGSPGLIDPTGSVIKESELDMRWQVTFKLIEKLKEDVEKDGGRLALCVIPTMVQTYDSKWKLLLEKYPEASKSWERFRPQQALEKLAQKEGIPYIPLTRLMVEEIEASGRMLYIPGDYHFNEEGHEFMARVLEPIIEKMVQEQANRDLKSIPQ